MRIEWHAFIKMSNILMEESYLVRLTNASCRLTFGYEVSVEVSTVSVEFQLGGEGSWVSKHWYLGVGWSRGIEYSKVG